MQQVFISANSVTNGRSLCNLILPSFPNEKSSYILKLNHSVSIIVVTDDQFSSLGVSQR
jgi:hypothetical protein